MSVVVAVVDLSTLKFDGGVMGDVWSARASFADVCGGDCKWRFVDLAASASLRGVVTSLLLFPSHVLSVVGLIAITLIEGVVS